MEKIIVSLTSYPKRIAEVDRVIRTLLIQTHKPDKILLWLSEKEFPQKEEELPKGLTGLCQYGLEIRWVSEDLKSHKKYFYAMQEFRRDILVTVDDDIYYTPELLACLYRSYCRHPHAVSCARANLIGYDSQGQVIPYKNWEKNYSRYQDVELMDLLAVGCGGVLYPPGCFDLDVLCDVQTIRNSCLCQDDLWLKTNEILKGIPTVLVKESGQLATPAVMGSQEVALCDNINVSGNDVSLGKLGQYLSVRTGKSWGEAVSTGGETVFSQLEKQRKEMEELMQKTRQHGMYIYGAGEGARATYECLALGNRLEAVKGFMVTDSRNNPEKIYDLPVVEIGAVKDRQCLILISTADRLQPEIEALVKKSGFGNVLAVNNQLIGDFRICQSKMADMKDFLTFCKRC